VGRAARRRPAVAGRFPSASRHLPQIAVFAGKHFTAEKQVVKGGSHPTAGSRRSMGRDRVPASSPLLLLGKHSTFALDHAPRAASGLPKPPKDQRQREGGVSFAPEMFEVPQRRAHLRRK